MASTDSRPNKYASTIWQDKLLMTAQFMKHGDVHSEPCVIVPWNDAYYGVDDKGKSPKVVQAFLDDDECEEIMVISPYVAKNDGSPAEAVMRYLLRKFRIGEKLPESDDEAEPAWYSHHARMIGK